MPSLGYKSFRVVAGGEWRCPGAARPMTADNGLLENRFYRVRFDAATGAITSIFDKQLKVELVDQAAPHKFNEYLYERYETPNVKDGSKWYRVQSATLHGSAGPVSARMTVRASAVGSGEDRAERDPLQRSETHRFRARPGEIPLGPRLPRRLDGDVQNKESVYVALPLGDSRFPLPP